MSDHHIPLGALLKRGVFLQSSGRSYRNSIKYYRTIHMESRADGKRNLGAALPNLWHRAGFRWRSIGARLGVKIKPAPPNLPAPSKGEPDENTRCNHGNRRGPV